MSNSIYGNNANVDLPSRNESSPSNINGVSNFSDATKMVNETSVEHLTSVYDTILYLGMLLSCHRIFLDPFSVCVQSINIVTKWGIQFFM